MAEILPGALILLGAFALIPLAGYAATDSWRGAWDALRQFLLIMGALVVIGGGTGLLMALAEHGPGLMWSAITGR